MHVAELPRFFQRSSSSDSSDPLAAPDALCRTAGSKGIGEGCVRAFKDAGAHVVFCSRNETEGKSLEDQLNAQVTENMSLPVLT